MHERHQEIREAVTEFIRSHFARARTDAFTPQANLLEEGIVDSMGLLDIIGFLEHAFAIRVREDDLVTENFGSVNALIGFVERQLEGRAADTAVSDDDDGDMDNRAASSG